VRAPIERCFDLCRDIETHCRTAAFTGERALPPGKTSGLLELGDTVTFEGRHFGLRLRLTARIVEMRRPERFVDEAVQSPFTWLRHVHDFRQVGKGTKIVDTVRWETPAGALGRVVDRLFLERHMRRFLRRKQDALRALAEGDLPLP
jgi:ligand-binding SRPBCC domain-containing protein